MLQRTNVRGIDDVFCALCMVCPGSALSWNRQDCNKQNMQQVKHFVSWDWSGFKFSDTNVVLQTTSFLILVVRNNKSTSDIHNKTSDCLSKNSLHYHYLELRFCY